MAKTSLTRPVPCQPRGCEEPEARARASGRIIKSPFPDDPLKAGGVRVPPPPVILVRLRLGALGQLAIRDYAAAVVDHYCAAPGVGIDASRARSDAPEISVNSHIGGQQRPEPARVVWQRFRKAAFPPALACS